MKSFESLKKSCLVFILGLITVACGTQNPQKLPQPTPFSPSSVVGRWELKELSVFADNKLKNFLSAQEDTGDIGDINEFNSLKNIEFTNTHFITDAHLPDHQWQHRDYRKKRTLIHWEGNRFLSDSPDDQQVVLKAELKDSELILTLETKIIDPETDKEVLARLVFTYKRYVAPATETGTHQRTSPNRATEQEIIEPSYA